MPYFYREVVENLRWVTSPIQVQTSEIAKTLVYVSFTLFLYNISFFKYKYIIQGEFWDIKKAHNFYRILFGVFRLAH